MTPQHIYITKEDAEYLADNMTAGMTAHTQRPMLHTGTELLKYTDLSKVFCLQHDKARTTPDIKSDDKCLAFLRSGDALIASAEYFSAHIDEVLYLAKLEDIKKLLKT